MLFCLGISVGTPGSLDSDSTILWGLCLDALNYLWSETLIEPIDSTPYHITTQINTSIKVYQKARPLFKQVGPLNAGMSQNSRRSTPIDNASSS